jgi:hypothetical protein
VTGRQSSLSPGIAKRVVGQFPPNEAAKGSLELEDGHQDGGVVVAETDELQPHGREGEERVADTLRHEDLGRRNPHHELGLPNHLCHVLLSTRAVGVAMACWEMRFDGEEAVQGPNVAEVAGELQQPPKARAARGVVRAVCDQRQDRRHHKA